MTDHPTEQDVDAAHERKARGYVSLFARFGGKRSLGDAILAKWRSNGDAQQKWDQLEVDVEAGGRRRLWLVKPRDKHDK